MKQRVRRASIGVHLGFGLGVVVLLTVVLVALNFWSSRRSSGEIRTTADFRVTTVLISNEAQTALLEMLMNLHAFLAQERPVFRQRFEDNQSRFEAQLRALARLSALRDSLEGRARLRMLEDHYQEWRVLPPQLFELTGAPLKNRPALRLMVEEGETPVNVVQRLTADILTLQSRREASRESIGLVSRLAAFQGTFDGLVGALRGYLNRPDARLRFEFQSQLTRNESAWRELQAQSEQLSPRQRDDLRNIALAREVFLALPEQIFSIVDSGRYREDLYLLETQVEPLANELIQVLDAMVNDHRLELTRELESGLERLKDARFQSLLAGFLVVLLGGGLGFVVRRRIVGPLSRLDEAARRLASGDLGSRATVEATDEVGRLATTFNAMAERLTHTVSDLEEHRWELTALNMQLEARVTERTTALEEARDEAEAARRGAELANQAKSSFLANMSHELRTPLNGILGYAQILQREPDLSEAQQQGVEVIQRSGDYLLTLINDVLDLAKIESDRTELETAPVVLKGFLRGLVDLFRMRTEEKAVRFEYQALSPLPVAVVADEKRLRQILINLLSNAVKFTEQGHVILGVAHEPPRLRFRVEDSGIGISDADLPHIFEPFRQVGERRYRSAGTGLGLSITHQLVALMDGEIRVQSEPGVGSVFEVSLPLALATDADIEFSAARIDGYRGPRRRLLVVASGAQVADTALLKGLLEPLGFMVLEANNPSAGLSLARYEIPDLLLLDVSTPVQEGLQLVRRWKGDPLLAKIPVVMISASVFQHHRQAALEAGCAGFVPKPVRLEVLLDILGRLLALEWSTTQVVEAEAASTDTEVEVGPDPQLAGQLLEFAQQGDIAAIEGLLAELAGDAQLAAFVARVRELVADFQVEEIGELVRSYTEAGD